MCLSLPQWPLKFPVGLKRWKHWSWPPLASDKKEAFILQHITMTNNKTLTICVIIIIFAQLKHWNWLLNTVTFSVTIMTNYYCGIWCLYIHICESHNEWNTPQKKNLYHMVMKILTSFVVHKTKWNKKVCWDLDKK